MSIQKRHELSGSFSVISLFVVLLTFIGSVQAEQEPTPVPDISTPVPLLGGFGRSMNAAPTPTPTPETAGAVEGKRTIAISDQNLSNWAAKGRVSQQDGSIGEGADHWVAELAPTEKTERNTGDSSRLLRRLNGTLQRCRSVARKRDYHLKTSQKGGTPSDWAKRTIDACNAVTADWGAWYGAAQAELAAEISAVPEGDQTAIKREFWRETRQRCESILERWQSLIGEVEGDVKRLSQPPDDWIQKRVDYGPEGEIRSGTINKVAEKQQAERLEQAKRWMQAVRNLATEQERELDRLIASARRDGAQPGWFRNN